RPVGPVPGVGGAGAAVDPRGRGGFGLAAVAGDPGGRRAAAPDHLRFLGGALAWSGPDLGMGLPLQPVRPGRMGGARRANRVAARPPGAAGDRGLPDRAAYRADLRGAPVGAEPGSRARSLRLAAGIGWRLH